MSYYLRVLPDSSTQLWKIEGGTAVHLGVSNPETGPGSYFRAEPDETVWDVIRRSTPWLQPEGTNPFHKLALRPGEFHPRIMRPIYDHPAANLGLVAGPPIDPNLVAIARSQLAALSHQLDRICQTVHPTEATLDVFGHDIRNLLILACTEVETHWRGVLAANGVTPDRPTTRDYVVLKDAMKLDEFAIAHRRYPWLPPFRPYRGWGSRGKPTQDLSWYDAYNAAKHDRETRFEQATLRHLFDAISATAIMFAAQFGLAAGFGDSTDLGSFFRFVGIPSWATGDTYVHPCGEPIFDWVTTPYRFAERR